MQLHISRQLGNFVTKIQMRLLVYLKSILNKIRKIIFVFTTFHFEIAIKCSKWRFKKQSKILHSETPGKMYMSDMVKFDEKLLTC